MELGRTRLRFIDKNGHVILDKALVGIPLKNSVIIAHSIEYFDDPEPCMIHRSAVMKRLFCEILEYFDTCAAGKGGRLPWNDIQVSVKDCFDIEGEIESVTAYTK